MVSNLQVAIQAADPLRLLPLAPAHRCHRHRYRYNLAGGTLLRPRLVLVVSNLQVAIQPADPLRLLPPDTKRLLRLPTFRPW